MQRGQMAEAPNYTNATLVMALVNLLWIFMVIWAVFGLPIVMVIGFVINRGIHWLGRRRAS